MTLAAPRLMRQGDCPFVSFFSLALERKLAAG